MNVPTSSGDYQVKCIDDGKVSVKIPKDEGIKTFWKVVKGDWRKFSLD